MLERVGHLALVPMRDFATAAQVAAFYEVDPSTVRSTVEYHKDEFRATGYRVIKGAELRELKTASEDRTLFGSRSNAVGVFDRRAVLLLGMLLRDSAVAKEVRRYLLEAESKVHEAITAPAGTVVERIACPS